MPVSLPARIGPYRPTRHLGTGGMGAVYYAPDPDGGAPLAVKVLHQDFALDPAHRARFRRETAMLRKVTGPYLVPLVDADPDAQLPWLATAYVRGDTLHQYVRDSGAMGADNLLTFAAAVAHALACIHGAGVAHRDLKPTNVLLAADGPRVVDFGIAHHLDATAITATSVTTGTPGWMAPEQLTEGTTLPAGDIFAWGLLVAYAAAATHPFGTPTGITHRIVSAEPSLTGVPDTLLSLVREALHKEPQRRPSAAELAERTATAYGPTGTAVFPTVAYTRSLERGTGEADDVGTGSAAPLEGARWTVPLPADFAADQEEAPRESPKPTEEPTEEPAVEPGTASMEPTGTETTVRPAPRVPPVPPAPTPTPTPASAVAPDPSPVRRRARRRVVVYALTAVAVLGAAAAGIAAGMTTGDQEEGASGRPSSAVTTAGPRQSVAAPAPSTATPSASASPVAEEAAVEEKPEPLALFGGLRITVPAGSGLAVRASDADTDSGTGWDATTDDEEAAVATSAYFDLHGDPETGVRVLYAPALTLDQIREGQTDSGAMWSTESEDGVTSADESVIAVKDLPLTGIGGRKAKSWTFGTDVLPDYDGSRKKSHRVWWLPYSKYLVYTYGTHDKAADAMVDDLIEGIRFERTQMPRDCADAVVALDKAAKSGEQADDHGALVNCQDAAVNGADQLDPGTVDTGSEAACVALAVAYSSGADLTYDEAKAYKELRPSCDVPGAVARPRLPDYLGL
ncbi:serine/threonine protein kinase [Streptomyces sp. NPDC059378]|uniref:serine/threonine protein kinase n=1 Tax=Streptomyces sp. NPDC059378 TaxID=3346815 RepID=UPI00367F402B